MIMAHFGSSRDPEEKVQLHEEFERCVAMEEWLVSSKYTASFLPLLLPQVRLGNSSRSPTVAGLVLEHLCPAILNILEDGLRDHKLDVIIGQRRNHPWSVVEVSARIGKFQ